MAFEMFTTVKTFPTAVDGADIEPVVLFLRISDARVLSGYTPATALFRQVGNRSGKGSTGSRETTLALLFFRRRGGGGSGGKGDLTIRVSNSSASSTGDGELGTIIITTGGAGGDRRGQRDLARGAELFWAGDGGRGLVLFLFGGLWEVFGGCRGGFLAFTGSRGPLFGVRDVRVVTRPALRDCAGL